MKDYRDCPYWEENKENTTEGKGLRVMSDIEKIIEGLELIEIVVPSYKHARRKGITDEEAEKLVNQAIEQAINILEQRTIDE